MNRFIPIIFIATIFASIILLAQATAIAFLFAHATAPPIMDAVKTQAPSVVFGTELTVVMPDRYLNAAGDDWDDAVMAERLPDSGDVYFDLEQFFKAPANATHNDRIAFLKIAVPHWTQFIIRVRELRPGLGVHAYVTVTRQYGPAVRQDKFMRREAFTAAEITDHQVQMSQWAELLEVMRPFYESLDTVPVSVYPLKLTSHGFDAHMAYVRQSIIMHGRIRKPLAAWVDYKCDHTGERDLTPAEWRDMLIECQAKASTIVWFHGFSEEVEWENDYYQIAFTIMQRIGPTSFYFPRNLPGVIRSKAA